MKIRKHHASRIVDSKFWETGSGLTLVSCSLDRDIKFLPIDEYEESLERVENSGSFSLSDLVYEICVLDCKMVGVVFESDSRIYENERRVDFTSVSSGEEF